MTWLFEDPLPVLVMGAIVTIALIVGFIKTGRKSILFGAAATVAVVLALLALERAIVTDREQVTQVLHQIADAIARNEIEEALSYVSPRAPGVAHARSELPRYQFHAVDIKPNLEIEVLPDQAPPTANARFNVVVELSGAHVGLGQRRYPRYVEVKLAKEADRWMVIDYSHHEPTRGMRVPAP